MGVDGDDGGIRSEEDSMVVDGSGCSKVYFDDEATDDASGIEICPPYQIGRLADIYFPFFSSPLGCGFASIQSEGSGKTSSGSQARQEKEC